MTAVDTITMLEEEGMTDPEFTPVDSVQGTV